MAASVPQIPKVVIFSLATVSFAEDVIDVGVFFTQGDVQSVTTLDGVIHQDISAGTWSIRGKAVQDWDSARPGLANYLWLHNGETVAFILKNETGAESAAKPKFTGSCVLHAISYAGVGNEFAEADFEFPITGTLTLDATP